MEAVLIEVTPPLRSSKERCALLVVVTSSPWLFGPWRSEGLNERRALHIVHPFVWPSRVRKPAAHAPGARLSGGRGEECHAHARRRRQLQVSRHGRDCSNVGSLVGSNDVATLFTGRGWQLTNGALEGLAHAGGVTHSPSVTFCGVHELPERSCLVLTTGA